MPRIAVVTDSSVCLPRELVEQYGIAVIPLLLIIEDKEYLDGVDITPGEFYAKLKQAKKLPTTSSPSPGQYLEVFQELSQRAEGILCITVSSKVSIVHDSARQAVELAKETIPQTPIELIDSRTATMAQGYMVLAAARAAAQGQSLDQVAQIVREMVPQANLLFLLDTLHYMAKGGRIPKAAAWASSLLSIKPILTLSERDSEGELTLLQRARTRSRGIDRLLSIMEERVVEGAPVRAAVHHVDALEAAQRLRERIQSRFHCEEFYITEATPVVGTHTGPGLLMLAFFSGI